MVLKAPTLSWSRWPLVFLWQCCHFCFLFFSCPRLIQSNGTGPGCVRGSVNPSLRTGLLLWSAVQQVGEQPLTFLFFSFLFFFFFLFFSFFHFFFQSFHPGSFINLSFRSVLPLRQRWQSPWTSLGCSLRRWSTASKPGLFRYSSAHVFSSALSPALAALSPAWRLVFHWACRAAGSPDSESFFFLLLLFLLFPWSTPLFTFFSFSFSFLSFPWGF